MISAVMVAGQGLHNYALCFAGTWVCLMFYTSIKAIIYIYLVERIHVVRAPFVNRRNDKIYICCMTMVIVMYSAVTINSYINNVTEMREPDGRCHFGIRGIVSIPFTVVNFFTDLVLTSVFFYLLRPVVRFSSISNISGMLSNTPNTKNLSEPKSRDETPIQRSIRVLLWKSIIGSLLIEVPMAANMIQFVVTRGEELGMLCLTLCLLDGRLPIHGREDT
ncbi:hypothetical protein BKA66DRAFT_416306 [Pyrenochaeta sp. MPI-SDFR-AT-0127]|nr:hypothetical protein BKA66DRAFT_416306 [Pyrenochaeta sp. MPI-SDFR-AT-0127]